LILGSLKLALGAYSKPPNGIRCRNLLGIHEQAGERLIMPYEALSKRLLSSMFIMRLLLFLRFLLTTQDPASALRRQTGEY
jgi:hypothetical protein